MVGVRTEQFPIIMDEVLVGYVIMIRFVFAYIKDELIEFTVTFYKQ